MRSTRLSFIAMTMMSITWVPECLVPHSTLDSLHDCFARLVILRCVWVTIVSKNHYIRYVYKKFPVDSILELDRQQGRIA
ncbi:hypothetical protein BDP67DRAFT_520443 [Colletotrichum lupini]|nr:hypothetical protein BDP67DRAFT_520443 [Colletotrichum lupini]